MLKSAQTLVLSSDEWGTERKRPIDCQQYENREHPRPIELHLQQTGRDQTRNRTAFSQCTRDLVTDVV
eukprot:3133743-Rhodomonas_salina.3